MRYKTESNKQTNKPADADSVAVVGGDRQVGGACKGGKGGRSVVTKDWALGGELTMLYTDGV